MSAPESAPRPRWDDWCVAFLLAVTALLTFWQIVARHVGSRLPLPPSLTNASYTEELARYLFIWTMLVGTAAALRRGEHLSLELWSLRAGSRTRRGLTLFHRGAWALFGGLLILGGVRVLALQWKTQQTTTLGWPVVWVTVAIPLTGLWLCLWAATSARSR